jgi:CDP-paratose synthetase
VSRKILITGATGFLGSHLLRKLISDGHEGLTITNFPDGTIARLSDIKDRLNIIDLGDKFWHEKISEYKINTVLHLATNYGRNHEDRDTIFQANYEFPKIIWNQMITTEDACFINTDTALPENLNYYSQSKKAFRNLIENNRSVRVINLVLEHFYGPHDGKFVSNIMQEFINKKDSLDLTEGSQRRDFVYFKDVLEAYTVILKKVDTWEKGFF